MSNNALYTIEQVDNKLIITVEAVKAETVEPEQVDLSKYKPFPMGHIATAGKRVVFIENSALCGKGTTGVVKTWYGHLATVVTDNGIEITVKSHKLAPLDSSDHPDYKDEQPEPRPMNADEIEDWVRRSLCTGFNPNKLTEHINALVQYELNKAKR